MNTLINITLFALLILFGAPPSAFCASENQETRSVFFLESGSVDTPWTRAVREGFTEQLDSSGIFYILYVEHLEAARFREKRQYELMVRYLDEKFKGREPDIFVAAGPAASNFLTTYPDLFPASKRVLIYPGQASIKNATVINKSENHTQVVREIIRLAAPKKIFIIGDSVKPSDRLRLKNIHSALEKEHIPHEIIADRPLPELLNAVSAIPKGNAIFFTPIYRKAGGRGLIPAHVLKKIHEVSRCPIFSGHDITLGFGAVGGYVHSAHKLGIMAGNAVSKGITGKEEPGISTPSGYAYDWNEVVRWGFEDRLHDNAKILFREPSIWSRYKRQVIVASVMFLALILLTTSLVIVNSRLRKTKKSLRRERKLLEVRVRERTAELSRLHKEAEKTARTDPLTGVCNRRHFTEIWEKEIAVHQRHTRPLAVLMLDIDHFKVVNDTYGHTTGDKALVHFAQTSANQLRPADRIGRFGGEEFVVLLPDTDATQAKQVAERIRTTVQETTRKQEVDIPPMTVSIGVAEVLEETRLEQIIHRADAALYKAKQSGRNRVCTA